jgi:hypothetical protein
MATNKLLPFANGVGANVVDYATWSSLSTLLGQGFVTGVARSDYANRVFAQGALASYILGQFVVDQTAQDADLNETTFYTNFKNALKAYVESNAVALNGAQTVGGVKTFTSSPVVPTVIAGDNTQKAASTAFVKKAIDDSVNNVKAVSYDAQTLTDPEKAQARANISAADASAVVDKTTNQTVGGVKTFDVSPIVPTESVTDDSQKAASTAFVKLVAGNPAYTDAVQLSGAQTITGGKTFSVSPDVPDLTTGDSTQKAANSAFVQQELSTMGDALQQNIDALRDEIRTVCNDIAGI